MSDFVIFSLAIVNLKFEIENWLLHLSQSCPRVTFLRPDPTRPGETLTRPDPRMPIKSLTRPGPPPPPYVLCFTSSTFKLPTGNTMQLLHDFEGNNGKYFSWGLVVFPEGEKNDLQRSWWISVKCIPGIIWTGLKSWVWTVFILQARVSRSSRVPDPTLCIRVQYCFNYIISTGNRDLDQGLYGSNRRCDAKSLSDLDY